MYTRILTGPKPKLQAPAGMCDTHIHFYAEGWTAVPGTPQPPAATVADYRQVMDWLGIQRVVVVQPNAYGFDNTVTLNAVAELGDCARAIVVVPPDISDADLQALHAKGVRGVRIMALLGGTLGMDKLEATAHRIAQMGWHVIVQLDGRELPQYESILRNLPCKVVIDHIGKFQQPVPPEHESFRCLLRLVDSGRIWVKLAAIYETSQSGAPDYADIGQLAKILAHHAPERMLWASNFPHAQAHRFGYPDEAALLDLLLDWAPDAAAIEKILSHNPAALYGF